MITLALPVHINTTNGRTEQDATITALKVNMLQVHREASTSNTPRHQVSQIELVNFVIQGVNFVQILHHNATNVKTTTICWMIEAHA
jgi:hypothetical protein